MAPLRSSKRPRSLRPEDYDHEIRLVDQSASSSTARSSSQSQIGNQRTRSNSQSHSRQRSTSALGRRQTLRHSLAQRKYARYQGQPQDAEGDAGNQGRIDVADVAVVTNHVRDQAEEAEDEPPRGRTATSTKPKAARKHRVSHDSSIEILYENQRGGFLCGMPLFSSKALGAADAAPWTNIGHKPSPTDIHNAQCPDPTWEWAWPQWKINLTEEVDEDGWEYSFMFSKKCSWHSSAWYNSFVRRRAWIRKRVKHNSKADTREAHRLNANYFTVANKDAAPGRSLSRADSTRHSVSSSQLRKIEQVQQEDIESIGQLIRALKVSRIDREKMEAIESFVESGGDDLQYLPEHMHEVMRQFVFQASRRLLLAHLVRELDAAHASFDKENEGAGSAESAESAETRRIHHLEAAAKAAGVEVKKLEYWSDIKGLAEDGMAPGAVDNSQGWDEKKWTGLDDSGPKDVLSTKQRGDGR